MVGLSAARRLVDVPATPTTWVVLLRGINVGRAKRVAMADLRDLLSSLGYEDVRTLLQSGNAVFGAPAGSRAKIEQAVSGAIEERLGLEVSTVSLTAAELDAVVQANPFVARGVDPSHLHVVFLGAKPPADRLATVDAKSLMPDAFEVGDRVLYVHQPEGFKASRLPDWSTLLGITVTQRNWNTTTRLHELALSS